MVERNQQEGTGGRQRAEPPLPRVWALIAVLACLAASLYLFRFDALTWGLGSISLLWWGLAVAFFVSEGNAVELPFKQRFHSFSLTELPLTIGVFLLEPQLLLLAVFLGSIPGHRFLRGIRGIKLVFNSVLMALEVGVAYVVFDALSSTADPLEWRSWVAAFAAASAACWISNFSVSLVLSLGSEPMTRAIILTDAALAVVTGATNACLAIIGVTLVQIDPAALVLLLIPAAVLLHAYHSILQRRHVERQLEKSELRFGALVQNSADVVAVIDPVGLVGFVSPSIERVLGHRADEVCGTMLFDVVDPIDRSRAEEELARITAAPGSIATFVVRARDTSGEERWLEVTLHNLTHDDAVEAIVANMRDVTERKRAEDEVRESGERLQSILDHANAAVFIKDLDGRYRLVNKALEEIHGMSKCEILGRSDADLWPDVADERRENDLRVMVSMSAIALEESMRDSSGVRTFLSNKFPLFDAAGNVTGVCGISSDITEAKRFEERLAQSEKMQAVGQLAGGIAHDFNNLLSIIQNYARFIIDELPSESAIRGDAEEILKAGTTAATLTRQLLAFSRKEVYRPNVVDLNEVVRSTCGMLRSALPENIDLELHLDDALANVRVDTGRMEQVIMNLALNARDAMDGGGRVTISTRNLAPGRAGTADAAAQVELKIADTGCGIPDDVLPHIFEPFFTTKSRDQGTGLGLASVYGIVQESRGDITVDSVAGAGTTFTVTLPACAAEVVDSVEAPPLPSGAGYRILLAEDERGVRNIAERILVSHGYDVVPAASGQEAYELWCDDAQGFDLLLADMIMPGMSGKELSELTGLNTLFMSGYTDRMLAADDLRSGEIAFLPKPFKSEELLAKVGDVLAARVG